MIPEQSENILPQVLKWCQISDSPKARPTALRRRATRLRKLGADCITAGEAALATADRLDAYADEKDRHR